MKTVKNLVVVRVVESVVVATVVAVVVMDTGQNVEDTISFDTGRQK